MSRIANRIKTIVGYTRLTSNAFAKAVGIDPANLSKMLNGKQPISEKTLYKISSTFPELNMEWLRTGEGEMLRRKEEGTVLKVPLQSERSQSNTNSPGAVNLAENATYNNYSSPPAGMRVEGVVEGVRPIVPTGHAQLQDYLAEANPFSIDADEFLDLFHIPSDPDEAEYFLSPEECQEIISIVNTYWLSNRPSEQWAKDILWWPTLVK